MLGQCGIKTMLRIWRAFSKVVWLALCVFAPPAGIPFLSAQFGPTPLSSSIVLSGYGCTTPAGSGSFSASSYSWGGDQSSTTSSSSGGTTLTVHYRDLAIAKSFDNCSSALAKAGAAGTRLSTLTLIHKDAQGNTVLTLKLYSVFVSSYHVTASTTSSGLTETVTFSYQAVQITNPGTNQNYCLTVTTTANCN